jgi:thiol-disulfide isomerase/thioredoxin
MFRKVFIVCLLIIFAMSCGKPKPDEKALAMWGAYNALLTKYQHLLKSAESDSLYRALLDNKKSDLNLLLQQYQSESSTAELELVRSQILIELKEYEIAGQLLDQLIAPESRYSTYARFHKVRVLQSTNKYVEALELFRPIEKKVAVNEQYLDVLFNFAFEAPDLKDQEYFSRELFNLNKWPENDLRYKSDIIENLALLEKMKGNAEEARKILNRGIAELTGTGSETSLQATLNLMDLIGKTAPELTAETWFNSKAFNLSDHQGKVVIIDFWAPWCAPCRVIIPTLVEIYQQNKDKGLVLLGYTRLYGHYRDERQRFDKVEPKEEIRLTREFLKRFNMVYPVAIAKGKEGFESYYIRGIPTLIMIDKQGQVADFKIGSGNEQFVKDRIQQLLNAN